MAAWEDPTGAALLVPPQKLPGAAQIQVLRPACRVTLVFTFVVKPQARTCLLTLSKCRLKRTSGLSAVGLNCVHVAVHARVRERGREREQ